MSRRRVVVTGMGMVSPIGNTVAASWQAALDGRSGVGSNEYFDTEDYGVKICAAVKDFDVTQYMAAKEARRMDPFIQFGMAAGAQAIEDAGLTEHPEDADRIGVAIGSGIGGIKRPGEQRPTPRFAFLCAGIGDQYDFRQPFDSVRLQRSQYRGGDSLYLRHPQYRFRRTHDPVWRGRRDGRRRLRIRHFAHLCCCL